MLKTPRGCTNVSMAVVGAAQAVWACTVSSHRRSELLKNGLLEKIGGLLSTSDIQVLIPTVGIMHRCLVQVNNHY